jgi:hypothetical protein
MVHSHFRFLAASLRIRSGTRVHSKRADTQPVAIGAFKFAAVREALIDGN